MQSMIEGKEKENKSPSKFDFEGIEIYIRLEDRPSSISVKGFGSTSNFRRPAKKFRIKDEYSGISIKPTPLGPEKSVRIKQTPLGPEKKVSALWRYPLYRDSLQNRIFSKNKSRMGR